MVSYLNQSQTDCSFTKLLQQIIQIQYYFIFITLQMDYNYFSSCFSSYLLQD